MKREWHVGLANVGPPIPDAISVKNIIPKKKDRFIVCLFWEPSETGGFNAIFS